MSKNIGNKCPFCKSAFKDGDDVNVCPSCGIPHHQECWNENKGCTTFGCSAQHYESQGTNISDVCSKCDSPLGDGQEYCPKCGSPKGAPKANVCGKCGAELQEEQQFCPKCGQKSGLVVDLGIAAKIGQANAVVAKTKKKKVIIPIVAGALVVVIVAAILLFGGGGTVDFKKMFAVYSGKEWFTVGNDNSYITIDTNPNDIDLLSLAAVDLSELTIEELDEHGLLVEKISALSDAAWEAIKNVNIQLGFTEALNERMRTTTIKQGRQTDENDIVRVSWFQTINGFNVTYEKKK